MYSEDIYTSHMTDHSALLIYSILFGIMVGGVLLKMVFNTQSNEYVHMD